MNQCLAEGWKKVIKVHRAISNLKTGGQSDWLSGPCSDKHVEQGTH